MRPPPIFAWLTLPEKAGPRGRSRVMKTPGEQRGVVPADAKAVAVGRLGVEPGVQALVDQRVDGGVQHLREQDWRARVSQPAAYAPLLSVDGRSAGPARFSQRP